MLRVSATDAAFLAVESSSWHLHVSTLLVVERPPPGWAARVRTLLDRRLASAPRFTRRVVEVPFGLDRPLWVDEADIDLDLHLHRVGVPRPGGPAELEELLGDLIGTRIDRHHALWELWVVERLADGRVVLLAKTHHAAVDESSGSGIAQILLDADPEPVLPHVVDRVTMTEVVPEPLELAVRGVGSLMLAPVRLARALPVMARDTASAWGWSPGPPAFRAPRTILDGELTPHRRVALTSVPLADVKAVRAAFGVTLLDVVLTLCAASLRSYLREHDALPREPLVAQVPLSTTPEDASAAGPQVSPVAVSLATHLADPVARLRAVHASTHGAREIERAVPADALVHLSGTTPPGLVALAARAYASASLDRLRPPVCNVVITSVPGFAEPRFVAGARVDAIYTLPELSPGVGCSWSASSTSTTLDLAVLTCREIVDDPRRLADAVPAALDELVAAARARAPKRPRRAPDS